MTRAPSATVSPGAERAAAGKPLLSVSNLTVSFGQADPVVRGVSFDVPAGSCVALVGESGSGKSVTARSIIGLAGDTARVGADRLEVSGSDILSLSTSKLRRLRGGTVGFVLQDALVSLDPLRPVGREIADALRLHTTLSAAGRRERVRELLERVGVPDPEHRAKQRSGELSGGLRQRALIASAIAANPALVIADEPTTALDATVQEQILLLLEDLKASGTSLLLISHDLAVVNRIADTIVVMKDGRVVESGPAEQILTAPEHPYTKQLIKAVPAGKPRHTPLSTEPTRLSITPRLSAASDENASVPTTAAVLEATGLVKSYRNPDGTLRRAVDDVTFALAPGSTLGVVGESGSGKSTTARIVLGITSPEEGEVRLLGNDWSSLSERDRRPQRTRIGAIYQDPLSSFDPRWSVNSILLDALTQGRRESRDAVREREAEIADLLDAVGLPSTVGARRPRHLSGGQRQRVAIARALAPRPEVIVCDEPVSALDVSVQAQVLDLLDELQRVLHLSYLFISHDLGVVQHMSDEVAVMSQGRIIESGRADQIFDHPQHDYTKQLLRASPRLGS